MKSPQILVIEYDHDTRVAYRKALENSGYVITSTANGRSGIEILERDLGEIQLVILCLKMPIMDGNDFLKLKSESVHLNSIPVIVITEVPNALRYPATEILQKPIPAPELLKAVRKYLSPSQAVTSVE